MTPQSMNKYQKNFEITPIKAEMTMRPKKNGKKPNVGPFALIGNS